MDGLTGLAEKLFSQCGLVSTILLAWVVWLMTQLSKAREMGESDRAAAMKLLNDQIDANKEIAVLLGKAEVMLTALQARHQGDND
jgi:hypothetical protein